MRAGRLGGRIGTSSPPSSYSASGIWTLSDVYSAYRGLFSGFGSNWPANTLSIVWPTSPYWPYATGDFADATGTGSGTFSPSITTDYPSVAYSWEISTNSGGTWSAVPGEAGQSLSVSGKTISDDGTLYRLVANAGLREVRSSSGTLRYDSVTVSFSYGPTNYTTTSTAYFDAYATATGVTYGGSYSPAYQWQQSTDGGSTWSNMSGKTSSTLMLSATPEMDNYRYRCVASFDGQSATSGSARLLYG